jgi:hypothetical protein
MQPEATAPPPSAAYSFELCCCRLSERASAQAPPLRPSWAGPQRQGCRRRCAAAAAAAAAPQLQQSQATC